MLPCPSADSTVTRPPCSSTKRLTSARPRPGALELAAGAAVGLAEGLEDELAVARVDADAVVGHRDRDAGAAQRRVRRGLPAQPHRHLGLR